MSDQKRGATTTFRDRDGPGSGDGERLIRRRSTATGRLAMGLLRSSSEEHPRLPSRPQSAVRTPSSPNYEGRTPTCSKRSTAACPPLVPRLATWRQIKTATLRSLTPLPRPGRSGKAGSTLSAARVSRLSENGVHHREELGCHVVCMSPLRCSVPAGRVASHLTSVFLLTR